MSKYYRYFGLERDPFLDTADPYFYCELGALRKAKERLFDSVDASRGLTVVLGDPGTGKTSLSGALEQELLADDRAVLEKRTLVLVIDEAQNLSDENLEALRLLLNYQVPQRKLLNILLFGQGELETRVHGKGNLADRVDSWIRLDLLEDATLLAILDYRLGRAGLAPGGQLFSPDARVLLVQASGGVPRRMTMVAHLAMQE